MKTDSSILDRRIPWTEEPGGLQPMGFKSFPGGSDGKESTCNTGDLDSIPGLGKSPGEGNGSPLQYSCLEKSMDRGAWQATVHGVAKSWIQLSDCHFHFSPYQQTLNDYLNRYRRGI